MKKNKRKKTKEKTTNKNEKMKEKTINLED